MKKIVLRSGLYSALVMIALFLLKLMFLGNDNFPLQEVLGFASIVVALLFVFLGIKQYRDGVNHGILTFGKGMKVGILIVTIVSIVFGLFDIFYVYFINPEFFDKYYNFKLTEMQQTLGTAEFESWKKGMEANRAMFENPVFNFFVMAMTVFIIGVIITVISSLILMRKEGQRASFNPQGASA